jgi:2-methylaconitate cis-trans-isomerase PrpF
MDFCARAVFTGLHPTYPAGAAIATAAAACVSGTVMGGVCSFGDFEGEIEVRIGHPFGCFLVWVVIDGGEIVSGKIVRTAREIFEGKLSCY